MPLVHDGNTDPAERKRRAVWLALPLFLILVAPAGVLGLAYFRPVVLASPSHGVCLFWCSAAEEAAFGGIAGPDAILPPARANAPSVCRSRLIQLPAGTFVIERW